MTIAMPVATKADAQARFARHGSFASLAHRRRFRRCRTSGCVPLLLSGASSPVSPAVAQVILRPNTGIGVMDHPVVTAASRLFLAVLFVNRELAAGSISSVTNRTRPRRLPPAACCRTWRRENSRAHEIPERRPPAKMIASSTHIRRRSRVAQQRGSLTLPCSGSRNSGVTVGHAAVQTQRRTTSTHDPRSSAESRAHTAGTPSPSTRIA